MQLLNSKIIKSSIKESYASLIESFTVYESVTSTNNVLNSKLQETKPFQFCTAEHQSAGKGRLGRHWISPYGQNIYLSCAWLTHKKIHQLSGLSLVIGLACIRALESYGLLADFKLKWPNDIFFENKKLGGILIETLERHPHTLVKIGIGLNVNSQQHDLNCVEQPCTSLFLIETNEHDRNLIMSQLVNALISYCLQFQEHGFSEFQKLWFNYDYFFNQNIVLSQAQRKIVGKASGINELGNFLIQDENGIISEYAMGEVSVRTLS